MFGKLISSLAGLAGRLFSKAAPTIARVAGKVGGAVRGGVRLFDKGIKGYSAVKSAISEIPVVGGVAQDLISQGEQRLENLAKEKLGVDRQTAGQALEVARQIGEKLPGSENR
jgi:hypothetical protein